MTDNTHSTNARQAHVHHACQPAGTWTITLNKQQRDNLLLLLNVCGYPHGNPHAIPAMNFQTGDWLAEVATALGKEEKQPNGTRAVTSVVDKNDSPHPLPAQLLTSTTREQHEAPSTLADGACPTCEGLGTIPHMAFKRTKYGSSVLVAKPLECPDCEGTGGNSTEVEHLPHSELAPGEAVCSACGGNGYTPQLGFKRTKFGSNVLSATPISCVECQGAGYVTIGARSHQPPAHVTPLPAPAPVVLEEDTHAGLLTCPSCSAVIDAGLDS